MEVGPVTVREPLVTINGADRGQAHTLEAVSASLILLSSVVFALQITAVTPLTASTASQHIENQQAGVGEGVLDAAAKEGWLKSTILLWNNSTSGTAPKFDHTGESGTYNLAGPPTPLGEELNETFLDRGIAFDLNVRYLTIDGLVRSKEMVNMGTPSDHAVTVRRTVVLYDDDRLMNVSGGEFVAQDVNVSTTNYFAKDYYGADNPVYNVVEVELILWRL